MQKLKLKIASGKMINSNILVGEGIEPVKKIIKNSAFNFLRSQKLLEGKTICDLYAGSGNLGIEALSSGVHFVDFVEQIPQNSHVIKQNLNNLNLLEKAEVYTKDVLKFIEKNTTNYDIVFADPPYNIPTAHLLKNCYKILKKDGIFIYFHQKVKFIYEAINLEHITTRNFGKSSFSVYIRST